MKPHEETWVVDGGHRVETPGGKIEPTVNPPEREPPICALIAQAPAMARLLLAICAKGEEPYNDLMESLGEDLRKEIGTVLRAAGALPP